MGSKMNLNLWEPTRIGRESFPCCSYQCTFHSRYPTTLYFCRTKQREMSCHPEQRPPSALQQRDPCRFASRFVYCTRPRSSPSCPCFQKEEDVRMSGRIRCIALPPYDPSYLLQFVTTPTICESPSKANRTVSDPQDADRKEERSKIDPDSPSGPCRGRSTWSCRSRYQDRQARMGRLELLDPLCRRVFCRFESTTSEERKRRRLRAPSCSCFAPTTRVASRSFRPSLPKSFDPLLLPRSSPKVPSNSPRQKLHMNPDNHTIPFPECSRFLRNSFA